jgi:hypothetical protein
MHNQNNLPDEVKDKIANEAIKKLDETTEPISKEGEQS